jgi:hypothetical protein
MSAHHLASASLVALFGVILFISSHLFSVYRSAKMPSFQKAAVFLSLDQSASR